MGSPTISPRMGRTEWLIVVKLQISWTWRALKTEKQIFTSKNSFHTQFLDLLGAAKMNRIENRARPIRATD